MVLCIYKILTVYCSNAARASGITVLIKSAEIDEAFTKLLLQAMGEVQVHSIYTQNIFNSDYSEITTWNILQDLHNSTRGYFDGSSCAAISKTTS